MSTFLGKQGRTLFEMIRKYLRLEVEGIEHIPSKGRVLVIANHSGWSGFDAVMIGHEIYKQKKRIPRILAHQAFFLGGVGSVSEKMGLKKASIENGLKLLRKNNLVILFPEGEAGNFKPTSKRYQLQEFRRGFIRMALATQAPIIPTIVIGAEETHINLATLKLSKYLKNLLIPLPFNILPLPAKWKIKFLKPISLPHPSKEIENTALMHKLAAEIQAKMQTAITKELQSREWVYFPPRIRPPLL